MGAAGDRLAGGHRHLLPHLGIWVQAGALGGDLQSRDSRVELERHYKQNRVGISAKSNILHRLKSKQQVSGGQVSKCLPVK